MPCYLSSCTFENFTTDTCKEKGEEIDATFIHVNAVDDCQWMGTSFGCIKLGFWWHLKKCKAPTSFMYTCQPDRRMVSFLLFPYFWLPIRKSFGNLRSYSIPWQVKWNYLSKSWSPSCPLLSCGVLSGKNKRFQLKFIRCLIEILR